MKTPKPTTSVAPKKKPTMEDFAKLGLAVAMAAAKSKQNQKKK